MCENCKFCRDLKGYFCWCAQKNNRVQTSKQNECKKYIKKEEKTNG